MKYGNNFETAKRVANELLSIYSQKSEFLVVPLCYPEPANNMTKAHWIGKNSAEELVNKLNLSYKVGNIANVLSEVPVRDAKFTVEYVYIGDGQEINFQGLTKEAMMQNKLNWLEIPFGSNVGITKVTLKDPVSLPMDMYSLNVQINNFSSQTWTGKVSLKAGDYHYEEDCEINSAQELTADFLLPVSLQRGKIEIYDDSLIADNIYYFSKLIPSSLKLLIIGSSSFLRSALKPTNNTQSPFCVEAVKKLGQTDLRQFNVVILNGITDISKNDKIKLENFMSQDQRSIIVFLGDEVGNHLNDLVSQCCTIEEPVLPKGYVTLDWVDYNHPIFNVFIGSTTLKNIKFFKFHKTNAGKGIIAKLTGNYPFLVINKNLAVVTTQFIPHATDIVYKSAFVPLLFRIIISTVNKSYDKEFYIGQKINVSERLKAPTGEYLSEGMEFLIPGFYTTASETIGVNVIPEEGNPKRLGNEVAKILNIENIDLEKDLTGSDLSNFFLLLALFILLLEQFLLLIR